MFFPLYIESDEAYRQRVPWAVAALVLLMLGIHVPLAAHCSEPERLRLFYRYGLVAFDYHLWAALTCTLLHGGWAHLIANLAFLWVYGAPLERLIGTARFLAVYLIGALVSAHVHLATITSLRVDEPTIGASGAIAAVLGACLVLMPRARLRVAIFTLLSFRPLLVALPAWVVLGLWFVGQLFASLDLLGGSGEIAFWAHTAGFVAGAAVATALQVWQTRAFRAAEQAARAPLAAAWTAFLRRDWSAAGRELAAVEAATSVGTRGPAALLGALLLPTTGATPADQQAALLGACCHARDTEQDALLLTVYLQALAAQPEAAWPPFLHRDAGLAAVRLKHDDLAWVALRRALALGVTERREQVLRALETLARRRLQRPDLADRLAAARDG